MFVFGVFLLLTLSIAGIANWRTLKSYKLNSALTGSLNSSSAVMPNMPPAARNKPVPPGVTVALPATEAGRVFFAPVQPVTEPVGSRP